LFRKELILRGAVITETESAPAEVLQKDTLQPQLLENRKTRYTRQVIREAFLELLKVRPIEKITVTRICEIADISRGTFYLHFNDPYDLLERLENEFLANLEQKLMTKLTASRSDYSGYQLLA